MNFQKPPACLQNADSHEKQLWFPRLRRHAVRWHFRRQKKNGLLMLLFMEEVLHKLIANLSQGCIPSADCKISAINTKTPIFFHLNRL